MKKKIILLLIALVPAFYGHAQKLKGITAQGYLTDYQSSEDVESLKKAQENIDLAAVHPDTKDEPSIQVLKGQIYLALYEQDRKSTEKLFSNVTDEQKKLLAAFDNTPTTNLETSYQAFLKAKQLDTKGKYEKDLKAIDKIGTYFDYSGRAKYNSQKFSDAFTDFERAYDISNKTDTTLLYLSALSADYSKNLPKAKEYYTKMVDNKQARPNVYISLANTCFELKDTTAGLEVLKKGVQTYPTDVNIAMANANYYINKNKGEEVLKELNATIQANPNGINLYLIRGTIYDGIAATQRKDIDIDSVKRKHYEKTIKLAEADYLKVLTLDSINFYALFNLGILYYNKAVITNNQASEMADEKKYAKLNGKATYEFNCALPYLEKAGAQQPNDRSILIALRQIYARLNDQDKLKMVNDKLNKQ